MVRTATTLTSSSSLVFKSLHFTDNPKGQEEKQGSSFLQQDTPNTSRLTPLTSSPHSVFSLHAELKRSEDLAHMYIIATLLSSHIHICAGVLWAQKNNASQTKALLGAPRAALITAAVGRSIKPIISNLLMGVGRGTKQFPADTPRCPLRTPCSTLSIRREEDD